MLGAVGAYDWNGTVVMQLGNHSVVAKSNTFHNPLVERTEAMAGYVGTYKTESLTFLHSTCGNLLHLRPPCVVRFH